MRDYNIHPLSEEEKAAIRAKYGPKPPSRRERQEATAAVAKAKVVKMPLKADEPPRPFTEAELIRRQQIIDAVWERNLEARRELDEMYRHSCHRGPGDSDWGLR